MDEGLFYSEEALVNKVMFLTEYNDINIIVEDELKEYEYEKIFERMLKYSVKIFPMKGKPGVKKAFENYGETYEGKPTFYIVDGDFDIIMNKSMIQHNNYIYLEKYNIESYYIDSCAVHKFMCGKLKKVSKEIKKILEYSTWEKDTYEKLQRLFLNYLIAQKVFPQEKNVGISAHCYVEKNGAISLEKVCQYEESLKKRIKDYDKIKKQIIRKFEMDLSGDPTRLICGKYVLASLVTYLRRQKGVNFKEDDFRYFLVCEFDINKLDYVKDKIINIVEKKKCLKSS